MAVETKKSLNRTLFVGYLSMFLMVGVFGAWATQTGLNGAVIAPATLVVESYSKRVQHVEGGMVAKIQVKDGDRVEQGQDLIILDTTDTKAEVAIVSGLLDELLVKKARLDAQRNLETDMKLPEEIKSRDTEPGLADIIGGQQRLLVSSVESDNGKMDQLEQQIGQLTEQIKGIDGQTASKKTQLGLIRSELTSLQKLAKQGLVPKSRVLAVEREEARLKGEQSELVSTRASAESRIGEVKLRIIQVKDDRRTESLTELRETEARISELKEKRIAMTARLARTSIKAPITGTVYQLAVHTEGGVIGAGDTLMLIVPEGDDLVLQAQVSPNDRDQISVGQKAQVRFPSFNSALTPEVTAEVTQVAADVSQMDANSPPFYAVRLKISAAELKKLGDNQLKPGMMAEAFIQTNARSPLSYLLKPLIDQFAHAMRET